MLKIRRFPANKREAVKSWVGSPHPLLMVEGEEWQRLAFTAYRIDTLYFFVQIEDCSFHYYIPFSSPKKSDYHIKQDGTREAVLYRQKTNAEKLFVDKSRPKYLENTVENTVEDTRQNGKERQRI